MIFPTDTLALARALIGAVLVHEDGAGVVSGRIVETEGYPPGDPACHAYIGRTARNAGLFAAPGRAYVYRIYGRYHCLNVASEAEGVGAGVLLRAVEPLEGADRMAARRGVARRHDLARGPGRLAQAFGVGLAQQGVDFYAGGALRLEPPRSPCGPIGTSGRIGLTREADKPWRFYERGSPFVSGSGRMRA